MDRYFEWINELPEGAFVSAILLSAVVLTGIIVSILVLFKRGFGVNPEVVLIGLFVVLPAYVLLKHLGSPDKGE